MCGGTFGRYRGREGRTYRVVRGDLSETIYLEELGIEKMKLLELI